jgi:hypothetical protein
MIVIDVGSYCVSAKIKTRVYESGADGELNGEDEESPLFYKI